jgi:hypothetical protein
MKQLMFPQLLKTPQYFLEAESSSPYSLELSSGSYLSIEIKKEGVRVWNKYFRPG